MQLWLTIATVFEYGILVLLFLLSIWSISIMIDRRRFFSKQATVSDLETLRTLLETGTQTEAISWAERNSGLHDGVLKTAAPFAAEGNSEGVDRSVRSYLLSERPKYEQGLAVLATLGANAPFIGLFGTVLGIIRSFAALGENSGAAASVMSGISLALIATATGLFVAIPAVIAYNTFANRWKSLLAECDSIKELIVAYGTMKADRIASDRKA